MAGNEKIENKPYVIKRLRENGEDIKFYSDAVRHDVDCIKAAMEYNKNMNENNKYEWIKAYDYIPEDMKNNPEIIEYFITLFTAAPNNKLTKVEEKEWDKHIRMQQNEELNDKAAAAMSCEYYLDSMDLDIWKELSNIKSEKRHDKTKKLKDIISNMSEEEYISFMERYPSPARAFLDCSNLDDLVITVKDNYLISGRRPNIDFSEVEYDFGEETYTRK